MKEIILTTDDNGSEVVLKLGDSIKILLEENATSGYTWELNNDLPEQLVEIENDFKTSNQEGIGVSGQRVLTYQVQKKGNGVLSLKYWQFWNGDTSIADKFEISFDVK